ncbi:MAG: adenylate/guanylate cyclase domain-containing protein [Proteobacteria bacterium]|nr:adenylate/guanylate cyclase domain-containing protein [Pseudomonadota bacterium]
MDQGQSQVQGPASDPLEAEVLHDAFARETRRGVQLAVFGRLAIFALLFYSYITDARWALDNPVFRYRSALVAVAILSGLINYLISRKAARPVPWSFAFFAVDAGVICALVFGWVPEEIADYPQFLAVRLQDVLILAAVLCMAIFPLSARLIAVAGGALLSVWLGGIWWSFVHTPGARTDIGIREQATGWPDLLARLSHPQVLMLEYVALQAVLLVALSGLLLLGVRRGRELVIAAVRAEGESAFLARFFPPAIARAIAERGAQSLPTARGEVAVLFVDFDRTRGDVDLDRMQAWYRLVEQQVFEHGGLIDRFVGDPVMAVFGAPTGEGSAEAAPAAAAVDCAETVLAALDRQGFAGSAAGINFGEAISGEVGSERQRAFGVVGDTVNLARRMLDAARQAGRTLAASDAVIGRLAAGAPPGFARIEGVEVRGQAEPITVWAR